MFKCLNVKHLKDKFAISGNYINREIDRKIKSLKKRNSVEV